METPQNPGPGYDPVTAESQLSALLRDFQARATLFLAEHAEFPGNLYQTYASGAVALMTDPNAPAATRAQQAREVLAILYGGGLYVPEPDKFWRTDLGQLIYEAGDYPQAYLSVSAAAAVLRVGRQRMHQLLIGGKLERSTVVEGAPVSRLALRERWEKMRAVSA